MQGNTMDASLPLSSLKLLVPPLRLMSAALWQVTQQQSVKHYGTLEDFVCMVSDAMPQLLCDRRRSLLLLGLRAKMTQGMFDGELPTRPEHVQAHLDRIQSACSTKSRDVAVEEAKANLMALTQRLVVDPMERRCLPQELFDASFDKALQTLMGDFLSHLEELIPVPNFKQASSWLETAPNGVEECVLQFVSHSDDLSSLLKGKTGHQKNICNTVHSSLVEDFILSSLSNAAKISDPLDADDPDSQSEALPDWVSHADQGIELQREEIVESKVVTGQEKNNMGRGKEKGRGEVEQDVPSTQQSNTVTGQSQDSTNQGLDHGSLRGGTFPIPAVLSLIALNKSPIVFSPQSAHKVDGKESTRGQTDVICPSEQTGSSPVKKTALSPKQHIPQHVTSVNRPCPESFCGLADAHAENSETDVLAHLRSVSPPASDSTTPLGNISHNTQRVAHKCPQCGKCFIYRSQVIRHLRTRKQCSAPHKCSQCGQGFRTALALNEHVRAVCVDATFDCPLCRKSFPSAQEQHRHRLTHRTNTCFQCGAVFKTKRELSAHLRSHRSQPSHKCPQCGKSFRFLSSLSNHRQTHTASGGFACKKCVLSFGSVLERNAHRLTHRATELLCPVCGEVFTSQVKLHRHQQSHAEADGQQPRYECCYESCQEAFTGLTQLRIHQRGHAEKPFVCDQCPKAFRSAANLQGHKGSHTGERLHLCTECGKRFRTKEGMEGHLRIHTGEKPYPCSHCGKRFTALAGLNVHVRRHTGERPYVCEVCGKGWPSGGDLQKHMRCHTGEKPYECPQCGKTFAISCHLTEHIKTHSDDKPFVCPECGKCLKRKFDLKKHLLSHSDVRPYPCTYCNKSYTRRTHLNRHLQTHTNINPLPPTEFVAVSAAPLDGNA